MTARPKLTLLLLLCMTVGLGQSAAVTRADEDRAINWEHNAAPTSGARSK